MRGAWVSVDRDWYREESSEAFWRELNGSIGGRSRSQGRGQRASLGLLGAVGVTLALVLLANHAGALRPPRHGSISARPAPAPAQLLPPEPASKRIVLAPSRASTLSVLPASTGASR